MPTLIEMEQGSDAWHEWRLKGIGASESAALLLADPYGNTPRSLYMEKINPGSLDPGNQVFQRGHEVEAAVRAGVELDDGCEYPPACFEHSEYPFIHASLDGWSGKEGIEIKMVGREALAAPVQRHHIIQVNHQMLVMGVDHWTIVRHVRDGGPGGERREVIDADRSMQVMIQSACWQFWDDVQNRHMPDYTDQDWVPDDNAVIVSAVNWWRTAATTKDRKMRRDDLLALAKHPRVLCAGVKIQRHPFGERVTDTLKEAAGV